MIIDLEMIFEIHIGVMVGLKMTVRMDVDAMEAVETIEIEMKVVTEEVMQPMQGSLQEDTPHFHCLSAPLGVLEY